MRITDTSDLWWKNAVIYCVDIETFYDADGDGVGDLTGLARRIDYLAELGVTCLWLMPFYPSPGKDDGYDVADYYGVDPRLGTLGEMVEVLRTAHDRGIRVIADLVVNHTSDQHPWFQESRKSTDNPYRDWYIWRDTEPGDTSDEAVFPGVENSIWEKDEATGEWYLHHFYSHQPDLNFANPAVREEIARIIGFWAQMGVDGFRVDAVPFLLDATGLTEDTLERAGDPGELLLEMCAFLRRRTGDGILLGEVNLHYEDQYKFFGGRHGDGLTLQFDFNGMQALYLAMARGEAAPIIASLEKRRSFAYAEETQWANFLRNHDELTLDKLTEDERQEVFDAFGPDKEMQVYGRGLKRRLPTMLGGDLQRIKMAYSLLFALPGTPSIFYGEEIGMGENLGLKGRLAVRTPMQWTAKPDGGFSTAPVAEFVAPMPGDEWGAEHINVADQRGDETSLFTFIRSLTFLIRRHPELGWEDPEVLSVQDPAVFALCYRWEGGMAVIVHNLHAQARDVTLDVGGIEKGSRLIDLLAEEEIEGDPNAPFEVRLDGYGHRWLRVQSEGDHRLY